MSKLQDLSTLALLILSLLPSSCKVLLKKSKIPLTKRMIDLEEISPHMSPKELSVATQLIKPVSVMIKENVFLGKSKTIKTHLERDSNCLLSEVKKEKIHKRYPEIAPLATQRH
jgi:hypothetical protein